MTWAVSNNRQQVIGDYFAGILLRGVYRGWLSPMMGVDFGVDVRRTQVRASLSVLPTSDSGE